MRMARRRDILRMVGVPLIASVSGRAQDWRPEAPKLPQDEKDYTLRVTSRLVLLDVSVKDASGGFVSGLTKDDFHIYENDKPQTITQFSDNDIPVTIGLVVDESGSMQPKRGEVITAALVLIQASNPYDEIFVVNFNETVHFGLPNSVPFSDDISQLRAALWQGNSEGRTALYDAIETSLHHLEQGRRDKKTLVVISDGGDNVSTRKLPQVMNDLLLSSATVYTIGIFDEDDPERNPRVLERLARTSGGIAYFPSSLDQVVPICRQIAKDIRTRYTIGYVPSLQNGKAMRHIKVVASSPKHDKLIVRTRTDYLFPTDTEAGLR